MKILLITSLYPIPDNPARGIFIADRVDLLRKMGHEVRVLNPLPRMLRMHELRRSTLSGVARAPKYTTEDEGHIYHPKYSKFPDNNLMWWTRRSILRLLGKVERWLEQWRPEVISCHTIWPVGELASRLANRWDCPWIATVHGWDFDVGLNGRCKSHISELASDANRLIAVSERLVEVAKDIGSESSKSAGSNVAQSNAPSSPAILQLGRIGANLYANIVGIGVAVTLRSCFLPIHAGQKSVICWP